MFQRKHDLSRLLFFLLQSFLLLMLPLFGSTAPYFQDVTDAMGLDFRHINGFSAERRLVETMGSGGALFDFDNDGDLDLYLVQGNSLSSSTESPPTNRLYRNDAGVFVDITTSANVGDTGLWSRCCRRGLRF